MSSETASGKPVRLQVEAPDIPVVSAPSFVGRYSIYSPVSRSGTDEITKGRTHSRNRGWT